MYFPTHPPLRCKAHWQNAPSQRYNQILPKSLPAHSKPTHGEQDSSAKMKDKLSRKMNNEPLTSATRQVRQRWFSVCIFPLGPATAGLKGNRPQSAPACSFLRYASLYLPHLNSMTELN
jgi:hypothetical protein